MKIAVVSKVNYNSLISTAYSINVLKFFSKNNDLTILSNACSFYKKQGIKAKYVDINYLSFPSFSYYLINDRLINYKLKKIDYDMLVVWYDSLLSFPTKKPVFRFVDICPYQSIGHSKKEEKIRFDKKIFLKMMIKSFNKSTFILTVSPQMRQFLIDSRITENKIKWLPHGVDLTRFNTTKYVNKQEEYNLINSGQFLAIRGGDLIVKTMKIISEKDDKIKYISLGNSENEFKEWEPVFEKNGLNRQIKLIGVLDNKNIPDFLSKAKIGISILEKNEYYNKSPPQKIFEYMAMGLPTIANDIPTHTDYIRDGYNGFIINSAEEMADIIFKLKNDKKLYKKISDNAKKSSKEYDLEKVMSKLKVYVDEVSNTGVQKK